MAITLARPVYDYEPVMVAADRVTRIDVLGVPASLREHAHTMLAGAHGPAVAKRWFTMGTFARDGQNVTVAVRVTPGVSILAYGMVDAPKPVPAPQPRRAVLVCPKCQDVRPDADVVGQGMSLGADCVFIDCNGTYTDPR